MTPLFPALALLQMPANSALGPIFMYGAIFAIFYFFLIRPGQKQRKALDLLVSQVKKGDEIVTTGGLVGEVIQIKETTSADGKRVPTEDRIIIRTGESKVMIERGRIARVSRSSGTPAVSG